MNAPLITDQVGQEDAWYLPQLFADPNARRIAVEAFTQYARETLGRDRSIADELANYFKG